ncbi:MAG: FlgO family outer membrane protein [Desulforhopalus sp.]|nr:FlgO family outer membrane protein [Desulforhopalus sp.]
MRKFTNTLLFLLFVSLIPLQAFADFSKTKIAVLDFQLQGENFDNKDMGTIVAEWFITAMVREGRFDVVERRMLEKILGEQKLAMTGIVDANSATQIGKLLGVKVIITGSVMKLREVTEINARIIDVESASIIAAENIKSSATTKLQDMVIEMSDKIIKNFPLEGYVVNRSGDTVTLDLGIRTGVKTNMRFIVYKEGQIIKHPKTGEVLDVERIETGKITITSVQQKICTAKIDEETSPGSVNYSQLVKSMIDTSPKKAKLTVETVPAGSKIRLLNVSQVYERGMILEPGPYHVEVTASGYRMAKEWITVGANEEKIVTITLTASSPAADEPPAKPAVSVKRETYTPPPPPPQFAPPPQAPQMPSLTSEQAKYLRMLESNNTREQKNAAQLMVRSNLRDPVVLDVVEKILLNGYKTSGTDHDRNDTVDTLSWLCKALGASGNSKYRATLSKVASEAPNRKLKGYAEKSLNQR